MIRNNEIWIKNIKKLSNYTTIKKWIKYRLLTLIRRECVNLFNDSKIYEILVVW